MKFLKRFDFPPAPWKRWAKDLLP